MTVKSTININKAYKDQLEILVKENELASITEGINLALSQFLKERRRAEYYSQMKAAAKDSDFLERTMESQKDFENIDAEVSGEW